MFDDFLQFRGWIGVLLTCGGIAFEFGTSTIAASRVTTREIALSGTAAGGEIYLFQRLPVIAKCASVQTTPGESAESVIQRLAGILNGPDPVWLWQNPDVKYNVPRSALEVQAISNKLTRLPLPDWFFSGTDTGFMIPKPPLSVSASYDPEKQQIAMYWVNPDEAYDKIRVCGRTLPPGQTSCVFDVSGRPPSERLHGYHDVIGMKQGMPSPPATIELSANAQEELNGFPFYRGLAPNWSAWLTGDNPRAAKFEQGVKTNAPQIRYVFTPDHKPFFQRVTTLASGVQAGVWRKFLGLVPGHTYKIEVRLNTLEMDACTNDWSLSFHATHDDKGGKNLTAEQLAGLAPLPDGSIGPAAGRIALYGPGVTTKGKWVKRSTDEPGPGLEIKNIPLPAGVTSITVWLRHSGANSTGVGMDWIRLEDVTPGQ